jgi:hypothetical protein
MAPPKMATTGARTNARDRGGRPIHGKSTRYPAAAPGMSDVPQNSIAPWKNFRSWNIESRNHSGRAG